MLENMYTKEEGARLEQRVGGLEERVGGLEERVGGLEAEIRAMRKDMVYFMQRLDTLEEKSKSHDGFAKEIDSLRSQFNAFKAVFDKHMQEAH